MIKPHKYMNLKLSVINISSLIINYFDGLEDKSIKYHELYNKICDEVDEEINELYLDSLTFLFALGVIEYNKEEDRVVLIK